MEKELTTSLKLEKDRITGRLKEFQEQITLLQAEIKAASSQLGHINALLGAADGQLDENITPSAPALDNAATESDPVEIAQKILDEKAGEPVYYRNLADLVIQRGGHLPGQDPASTLVSRLVRDERFVRPFRRGWYALKVHHANARSVGQRLKIAHRRG